MSTAATVDCDEVPEPLSPTPLLLLLPSLGGGLFAGGLLLSLLGGGLEVLGLDVGQLPMESGRYPSGHVCVVVTGWASIMLTGGSVPLLLPRKIK